MDEEKVVIMYTSRLACIVTWALHYSDSPPIQKRRTLKKPESHLAQGMKYGKATAVKLSDVWMQDYMRIWHRCVYRSTARVISIVVPVLVWMPVRPSV